MKDIREFWINEVKQILEQYQEEASQPGNLPALIGETPPDPAMGDLAFPLFPFARVLKKSPVQIAQGVRDLLQVKHPHLECRAAGPYLNLFLPKTELVDQVVREVEESGPGYGKGSLYQGRRVMIEFSCPNTNKPLHLGHLRNDALGESTSRIFHGAGAYVYKVNLINNRGIHICKSMLAYQKFGQGETPQSTGEKEDHFVGRYYVKYNQWAQKDPRAEEEARAMLRAWEEGDPEIHELWKRMNGWTLEGIEKTYRRTGISFDKIYLESETYLKGKEEILKGLEKGVFYKEEDGSIQVDLSGIGLDKKVLLRQDGTSLYLTQDIGTAIARQDDWPFEELVYVVGSEQEYHFKVLFHVLSLLGFEWASQLYHLSYGMVNLPEGKMKSREGTVVDADDLLDKLTAMAREEIIAKGREKEVDDLDATASKIALGALHYYLLQTSPNKDMIFDPKESLSFNGNTGPYLQYMGARINSVLKKYEKGIDRYGKGQWKAELLDSPEEWELVKTISRFGETVENAAQEKNPALMTAYLYELGKNFSRFYHDHPVLKEDAPDQTFSRVRLCRASLQVLKNAFKLVNIPYLESM